MKTYVLIDRSGSMSSVWPEMTAAMNSYVAGLKKGKLHIACFDSQATRGGKRKDLFSQPQTAMDYRVLHDGKCKDWSSNVMGEYHPRGMTPLYDAVGRLNGVITKDSPKKAQIVIVTDGYENASTEMTQHAVKTIVANWEDEGFDVVYMGASFEGAYQSSAAMGIKASKTVNMTEGAAFESTMSTVATRATAYAAGTVSGDDDLSEDTRIAAGESDK